MNMQIQKVMILAAITVMFVVLSSDGQYSFDISSSTFLCLTFKQLFQSFISWVLLVLNLSFQLCYR